MNNIEFVSAGAGSGKTYKLTETLAQALESGAARPHAILATTFTVKAATELRERARSWLLEKGRVDLATAIGQARLGTVNSVCGQMLKQFCFELGLSPDQTVLSEGQTKRLLETSLAETLDPVGQSDFVQLTRKFGIEQEDWAKTVKDVVKAALDNDIAPATLRTMGPRNADQMLANWPAPAAGGDPTAVLAAAVVTARQEVAAYVDAQNAAGAKVAKNLQEGLAELQKLERAFREGRWSWPDWIGAAGIDAGAKVKHFLEPVKAAAQAHESHPVYLALGQAVAELLASGIQVEDKATKTLRAIQPGDIGVLCRKHDQVDLAVTSLTQWGIPSASPRAGLLGTAEANKAHRASGSPAITWFTIGHTLEDSFSQSIGRTCDPTNRAVRQRRRCQDFVGFYWPARSSLCCCRRHVDKVHGALADGMEAKRR